MFLFVGADPETEWIADCGIALDAHGFVLTGQASGETPSARQPASLESNVRGVFAVGDVRSGSVKRVGGAIGEGAAMVMPAWAAIVAELVPPEDLPSAIALNSIAINVSRTIGPAIAGVLVAAVGAWLVFVLNALSYIGILAVLVRWRRQRRNRRRAKGCSREEPATSRCARTTCSGCSVIRPR